MIFFRDAECEEGAGLEGGDGFFFQGGVGSHEDGKEAEEGDLKAVAVGGAEVGEDFQEAGEAQEIELAAGCGKFFGGENGGVELV